MFSCWKSKTLLGPSDISQSECQQLKMPLDDEASEDDSDSVSSNSARAYIFQ